MLQPQGSGRLLSLSGTQVLLVLHSCEHAVGVLRYKPIDELRVVHIRGSLPRASSSHALLHKLSREVRHIMVNMSEVVIVQDSRHPAMQIRGALTPQFCHVMRYAVP